MHRFYHSNSLDLNQIISLDEFASHHALRVMRVKVDDFLILFNGDGFEDFVVAWAIFPHTIDQSKKIYGPINIYLNDQNGGFAEDLSLYAAYQLHWQLL